MVSSAIKSGAGGGAGSAADNGEDSGAKQAISNSERHTHAELVRARLAVARVTALLVTAINALLVSVLAETVPIVALETAVACIRFTQRN